MYNEQKANGALTRENQNAITKLQENEEKAHRSKSSTHSQQEEEIETGCEEEREGSSVPIFPPLGFRIVRILASWIGFYSKVSTMRVKCDWLIFELKRVLY